MATHITKKRFPDNTFVPGDNAHGLLCVNDILLAKDCIFDTSDLDIDDFDETVSVTWGGSAVFDHCRIRGGGKLCLIGSGDEHPPYEERGKKVVFNHCLLESAGRRCPEVQSGMVVEMNNCVIRDWGLPERWTVRAFGSWAHHGGKIHARNCVFLPYQGSIPLKYRIADKANWLGQEFNYEGVRSLFSSLSWRSGWTRALVASHGGVVTAVDCYFGDKAWTNAVCTGEMEESRAMKLVDDLITYFNKLESDLSF